MSRAIWLTALCLMIFHASAQAADRAALDHFEKRVRPLLAENCWRCHGPEKQKGGLRLDSAEALAQGGDTGPVVVPGKPEESTLIAAVRYDGDFKMPPKGKLDDAELAALSDWVRNGAPWSESSPAPGQNATAASSTPDEHPKDFWAFQPVTDPMPPAVADSSWPISPIDQFILAGLNAKALQPAPPAEMRTLLRRMSFDLTGLPPTPEETAQFLTAASHDPQTAIREAVDRLLASPRYGERWARYWLDLARYADSNGMDENVAYANAWRYRDYVVASFNADKPYDQFLKEQIAGDLLPAPDEQVRHDQITGTGFLVLGPKMLAEDDPVKMEMDIIDEQVDTVGKVFLGMTLGCARCHDHKFDPLPTTDYYALAGIFKSTKSMANHKVVAMWNERVLATPEQTAALTEHKRQVAEKENAVKKLTAEARKKLKDEVRARVADYLIATRDARRAATYLHPVMANSSPVADDVIVREAEAFDRGNVIVDRANYGKGIGVILNGGPTPNFAEYDFEIAEPGVFQIEIRYASDDTRPIRVTLNGEQLGDRVAGADLGSWGPEAQAWTVAGASRLEAGKATLRIERADGPIPHLDKLALVPRTLPEGLEIETLRSPETLALKRGLNPRLLDRWITALAQAERDPESIFQAWLEDPSAAVAKHYEQRFQQAADAASEAIEADPALAAFRRVLNDPKGPLTLPRKSDDLFPPKAAEQLAQLQKEISELEAKAPPVPEVMGVEDQKATNLKVHIRGSHLTLGAEVPRHFIQVIAGKDQPPIDADHSGRLELAKWLANRDNPLTARVMVNRLWQWHFGQGIVRTPDNFGRLGEAPTHPELLDWLATRFVESGWSMKAIHRLIMLSATYQMNARHDEAAALADPDNTLHWRYSRRRLEAEAVRDAILAVSGLLDNTPGGTRLPTKNHAYVNSTGSAQAAILYDVNLRSIYLPVIRSGLYSVFQAFDFADPSTSNGQRIPTTVAPQALFMMNDKLVLRASAKWAQALRARTDLDDVGRLRVAYETAYGRPPREDEISRDLDYLGRFDALLSAQGVKAEERPEKAWQALCQALMAASEFISIE